MIPYITNLMIFPRAVLTCAVLHILLPFFVLLCFYLELL